MAKNWTTLLKAATGYLQGKIEDGETLVGEELNNDIIQFFVKLLDLASITPSGNYDNETNGYELIQALTEKIKADVLAEVTASTLTKIVDIGDWDMNTNDTVTVNHGIADYKKIRSVSAIIRSDADTSNFDLSQMPPSGTVAGGIGSITSTTILLRRVTGGQFDNPSFAATSYNRGWVIIQYVA